VTAIPIKPRWTAIALSLLGAALLTLAPVPEWAAPWQPPWLTLVLAYWCLAEPDRIGITACFVTGLLQDTLYGTPLGQHALALTLVGTGVLAVHQRLRVLPLVQQALLLAPLLLAHQAVMGLVTGNAGRPVPVTVLGAALSGTLVWPWLFLALRELRRGGGR
jgi:rod shape-determining protein MreD